MRTLARLVQAAIIAAVGLGAHSAWATTYKVGPSQTYKQPSAVASLLKPGDVVEIDGDATYTGGVVFDQAGTASSKITVRGVAKNGKRPVLSGAATTLEAGGDHYVFEGLELTGGSSRCFFHHADDVTLRDSVIHDCAAHGVLGADADSGSLTMEYVEVHHCGGGIYHHQVYVATDETAHPGSVFRMQYCFVHDSNGGHNVKSRAERNEIYYNWVEGAEYHELELIGPDGQDESLAREDSDVVGNVLAKTNTFYVVRFGGDGTGQTWGRYRFVNNTVIVKPNASAVFHLFDGIESIEMHNNAFVVDGAGGPKIMGADEAVWRAGEQVAGSNNWVRSGATALPSQWTGTITGNDPGLVAIPNDPRLVPASMLVNVGATTLAGPPGHDFPKPLAAPAFVPPVRTLMAPGTAVARPSVGVIDIGAFEYGVGPTTGSGSGTGDASGNGSGSSSGSGGGTGGGTGPGTGGGAGGAAGSATNGVDGGSAAVSAQGALQGSGDGADASDGSSGGGCGVTPRAANASGVGALFAALALAFASRRRRRAR